MEISLSFGETWTLFGVWTTAKISSSLKWLFAVCTAVMDVLRWIVLGLHGNQGTGQVNGTCKQKWEEEAAGSYYAECVSSNLHTRILLEENLIKKKLAILQQESKEIHADWAIIQQRLVELNLSGKDEQEKTSNLEAQENQVGKNNSVRL